MKRYLIEDIYEKYMNWRKDSDEVKNIDQFGLDSLLNLNCAVKSNKGKICLCELSSDLDKKIKLIKFKKTKDEIKAFKEMGAIT